MSRRRSFPLIGVVLAIAVFVLLGAATPAKATGGVTPDQFISKIYTEALGRAPAGNGSEQYNADQYFSTNGCSLSTLTTWGSAVYNSSEYSGLGYDNTEKVLTLYEGVLSREPDSGYVGWVTSLNGGTSFASVVASFFGSAEFQGMVSAICSSTQAYYYETGPAPPLQLSTVGTGFTGTEASLQSTLNATSSGGTVYLAQRAVVYLTSTLTIPAGVTLSTTGAPGTNQYAKMGRLVRSWAPTSNSPEPSAVLIESGGQLDHVWVTGGRAYEPTSTGGGYWAAAANIKLNGGSGTVVSNVKSNDTFGGTSIFLMGPLFSATCSSATVSNNVVEDYNSNHYNSTWADGITSACGNATISGNTVADPSDVGIVMFKVPGGTQQSVVSGNTIYTAGESAWGGLAADATQASGSGGSSVTQSFSGASFTNNALWTSDRTYMKIALAVGTKAWFAANDYGTGVSFTNNTSPGYATSTPLYITAQEAIGVSGMYNATVTGNTFGVHQMGLPSPACPAGLVVASVTAGWASWTSYDYWTNDAAISGCITN
jgi:Domain of unknown function (DUF4214)